MKPKYLSFPTWIALALVMPASADVIYSNFQNIGIPANFAGVYLDVNGPNGWNTNMAAPVAGWDINVYYGGKDLANSPAFQPVRANNTANWAPITDLSAGATVSSGGIYSPFVQSGTGAEPPGAPGYGTSPMLMGSGGNFTAGTVGYIGFKLYTGAGYTVPVYGWMRVILGGATPVIEDWAYDTSGATIATGNVLQSAPSGNAQTVTLTSESGSFTLGSALTNTGGNTNSVVKTGAGTTTLTVTNTYGGTTMASQGTLLVNGSLAGSGTVSVAGMATLGGTGSIAGPVIVNGILSPGASIESLTTGALTLNSGSTFKYEMDSGAESTVAADFQKVFGDLALNGTVTLDLTNLAGPTGTFAAGTKLSLINYADAWNSGLFTYAGTPLANHGVFTAGLNTWQINYDAVSGGSNFASESTSGHFVTLTAVPEPGSWLALGCLMGSGVVLRHRKR